MEEWLSKDHTYVIVTYVKQDVTATVLWSKEDLLKLPNEQNKII